MCGGGGGGGGIPIRDAHLASTSFSASIFYYDGSMC